MVDPLHLIPEAFSCAGGAAEAVGDEVGDVEGFEAEGGKPDEHDCFLRGPVGPEELVGRHLGGLKDIWDDRWSDEK